MLVRIHAAGVNPYDTYMRGGTHALKPKLPYTPGSDGAGVVEAVGEGVKKVKCCLLITMYHCRARSATAMENRPSPATLLIIALAVPFSVGTLVAAGIVGRMFVDYCDTVQPASSAVSFADYCDTATALGIDRTARPPHRTLRRTSMDVTDPQLRHAPGMVRY